MSLRIRRAEEADFPEVERLCAQKPYWDSLFLSATELREFTLTHLRQNFERLRGNREAVLLVADREQELMGYMLLFLRTRETITQEWQTLIFDTAVPDYATLEEFLPVARRWARRARDSYLVVHLQEENRREQIWYYRLGFRPELNRVVKPVAPGFTGPTHPHYLVRKARNHEHLFIVRVNAEYSALYRPAGRDTDLQTVRKSFLGAYVNLNLQDQGMHYLILEERQTRLPAGYIILVEHELPMNKGLAYYTYDVAVAPEFAGRGLSLYLCGAAETLVGDRGGGLLFGDTSLDNRAAVNGDRQLGFQIDSKRWGLRV